MVQRRANRGARRGGFFWGCSRYPACRETVDIPSIVAAPDRLARSATPVVPTGPTDSIESLPGGGAVIGSAGGSARRTYERRRATSDARRTERLFRALPRAIVAAIVMGGLMAYTRQAFGVPIAALIGVVILLEAALPRQSTVAWATGAEGEERTASYLDPLASEGYVVFHDRKIPLSKANVDHIVIGPTGVFVVETKNVAGDLRVRGDEVRIGGRRIAIVEEVGREVDATWNAVASVLAPKGLPVIAVVCAHRADLPFFRRSVASIRIVSGRGLARYIRDQPQVLSTAEVQELRRLVARAMPGSG